MSSPPTSPPHPCLKWREGWENSQPSSTHSFIVGTWISNPFLLPLKKRKIDQYSHKFEKNRYFEKKRGSCSERSYTWITSWIGIIFSPMWHTTSLLLKYIWFYSIKLRNKLNISKSKNWNFEKYEKIYILEKTWVCLTHRHAWMHTPIWKFFSPTSYNTSLVSKYI